MKRNQPFFMTTALIFLISLHLLSSSSAIHEITAINETEWNFIVLGDTQQQYGTWDPDAQKYTHENASNPIRVAIANTIVENNPEAEFIICPGDMVYCGGEQDDWDRYYEDIENITASGIPMYYAVGNHDHYTYSTQYGYGPENDNFSVYMANVGMPGNERYYSFDYNEQIHFITVNTEENWTDDEFQITPDQLAWVTSDLENNTLDFIVAVFHRPCYSIRSRSRVEDAAEIRKVLKPLLVEHGVDLVFSGHDHYYYRTFRDEIMYVTTGGGGAQLYPNNDMSGWQEGDQFFMDYHYINVSVSVTEGEITAQIDVMRFNYEEGTTTLADSFEIPYTDQFTSESTTPAEIASVPVFSTLFSILTIVSFRKRFNNRK